LKGSNDYSGNTFINAGSFDLTGGSDLTNDNGFIGYDPNSSGAATVVVVDPNSGSLYVGGTDSAAGGTGSLTIDGGGEVVVGNQLKIWNPGTVSSQGGTLTADTIGHTDGGMFNWTPGTLHVSSFNGDLVNQGGTLAPGNSAGTTTVDGTYTQSSGDLEIELGGTGAGKFDKLIVNGTATLGGSLDVSIINNFTPQAGNSFDILDWGSLSGTFATLNLPCGPGGPGGGLTWDTSQLYTNGTLSVGGVVGDYNHDGTVDAADYVVWRKSLGQTGAGLAADGDFNNVVDAADLTA
jgi:hypothetical protein